MWDHQWCGKIVGVAAEIVTATSLEHCVDQCLEKAKKSGKMTCMSVTIIQNVGQSNSQLFNQPFPAKQGKIVTRPLNLDSQIRISLALSTNFWFPIVQLYWAGQMCERKQWRGIFHLFKGPLVNESKVDDWKKSYPYLFVLQPRKQRQQQLVSV